MIILKEIKKDDFKQIVKWNKKKSANYLLQWAGTMYHYPLTEAQLNAYFQQEVFIPNGKVSAYKIIEAKTKEFIGIIELHILDNDKKNGRIKRFLLGEESKRGQGIGSLVLNDVLNIGFENLNLSKIELGVFDFNVGAIKCYEKMGFKIEEVKNNYRKSEDGYWNLFEMAIHKEDR